MDFEQIRVWNLNFWRVWHSVGGQKQNWFHSQPQAPNLHILIHHAKKANRQHQNFAFSRTFTDRVFRLMESLTPTYSMLDKWITEAKRRRIWVNLGLPCHCAKAKLLLIFENTYIEPRCQIATSTASELVLFFPHPVIILNEKVFLH